MESINPITPMNPIEHTTLSNLSNGTPAATTKPKNNSIPKFFRYPLGVTLTSLLLLILLALAVTGTLRPFGASQQYKKEMRKEITENASLADAIKDTWEAHAHEIKNLNRDARFGGGDIRHNLPAEVFRRRFPLLLSGDGPKQKEILLETKHFKIPLLFIMTTNAKNIARGEAYACAALILPKQEGMTYPKGVEPYYLIPNQPETKVTLGVRLNEDWPPTTIKGGPTFTNQ
jgi:hypothetical protein